MIRILDVSNILFLMVIVGVFILLREENKNK